MSNISSESMSMSMNQCDFNARVSLSEHLERLMMNAAQDLAIRSVTECAERYNFDAEEAIRILGLNYVKMERKSSGNRVVAKVKSEPVAKPSFPLPYNGEPAKENCCLALRYNNGLYTQCHMSVKKNEFCKGCQALSDKSEDNVPEYGTIKQRQAVDIFEYVDPKGRKPVAYTKVMKKFKVSMEQVLEEAGKFNIQINDFHFVEPETETKRGRPKTVKEPKEPKGAKGRPKKEKKVLEIEDESEDLFASLVANAQLKYESDDEVEEVEGEVEGEEEAEVEEDEIVMKSAAPVVKKGKSDEEKEQERLAKVAKEQEKAAKEEQRQKEKAEKEAKKLADEQAKAEKKALEELIKQEKEEKRQQEKAEKEAKKLADEQAKALKKQQEEEAKAAKAAKKQPEAKASDESEEQPDVVKRIEFQGKNYLKSKKTGIVYDYKEYTQNGEQVVVGQWNEAKNAIDFKNDEESEEEYESDDDK